MYEPDDSARDRAANRALIAMTRSRRGMTLFCAAPAGCARRPTCSRSPRRSRITSGPMMRQHPLRGWRLLSGRKSMERADRKALPPSPGPRKQNVGEARRGCSDQQPDQRDKAEFKSVCWFRRLSRGVLHGQARGMPASRAMLPVCVPRSISCLCQRIDR